MNKKQIERLKELEKEYDCARGICDPLVFLHRQKHLLYEITEFLLEPLWDYEEKEFKQSNEEASSDPFG